MISSNLKILRKLNGRSQEEAATDLSIKRTTLSGYENGSAEPGIENLIRFADYYKVKLDDLIRQDLGNRTEEDWNKSEIIRNADLAGNHLRIIATTVNSENVDNIELVPMKARAGYTTGFADPEYIRVLPTFQLPFLSPNKKYRTFPIIGDSMPPVADGSWVTAEYLQNWNFIKSGHPYIIITREDGIVFKTVYNQLDERGSLLLCSTNPAYEPYEINVEAIQEVWKFTNYISSELPEPNLSRSELSSTVMQLQRDVNRLKNTLKDKATEV